MPISSLTETLHGDDEDLTLIEIVPDIDNSNEKTLTKISLYQGLDKLPKLEASIIFFCSTLNLLANSSTEGI